MRLHRCLTALLVLSLFLIVPPAHGEEGEPLSAFDRGLVLSTGSDGEYVPAPVLGATVEVRVTGIVARAKVTQVFTNPTEKWVEGIYVFPLPEGAAVDTLRLVVGDRVIEGIVQEKAEARQTYEAAKQQGIKASLVEQHRPDVFTNSVANIGPGETVEVVIELQQVVGWTEGRFSLRFPMVVARRSNTPGVNAPSGRNVPIPIAPIRPAGAPAVNPFAFHVDLAPGFPLARVKSPSHAVVVETGKNLRYAVDLARSVEPADSDFILEWAPAVGREPRAVFFSEEVDGETYSLLMVMPPDAPGAVTTRLPRETIFMIDTSGSMDGVSMEQARRALLLGLYGLQPGDWFNVVEFASYANALFPDSVPASPDAVAKAGHRVRALEADGSTNMIDALKLGLRQGQVPGGLVRQVIFITDGKVDNEAELFAHIRANLAERRLFTVAIGTAPNSFFLRKAAEFGRGSFTQISDVNQVESRMGTLLAQLSTPMLREIGVRWADPGAEAWPAHLPDLYLGEPLVVAARQNSAGEVEVSGLRGGEPWGDTFPAAAKVKGTGIDKLWARKKIDALTDSLVEGGDADEVRRAITELGLRHHLVTKHTSLVAVDVQATAPPHAQPETVVLPVNAPTPGGVVGGTGYGGDVVDEVITVSAESPMLDERRISTGATVSQTELEKIPTASDPWAILLASPGALIDRVNVGGNESGQTSTFTGLGSQGDQAVWSVDGMTLTDLGGLAASPSYLAFNSFEEMQVTTGGADATLATPGVRVNLVAPRGTFEWRGAAEAAAGEGAEGQGSQVNRLDDLRTGGFDLGGPLREDRAWIWGEAHRTGIDGVAFGGQPVETHLKSGALKLSAQLATANAFSLTARYGDTEGSGVGAGPDRALETTWDRDGREEVWHLQDTHIFGSDFYVTALLGTAGRTVDDLPRNGLTGQARIDPAGVARGAWFALAEDRRTREASLSATRFFDTDSGNHEILLGAGRRQHDLDFNLTAPAGGVLVAGQPLRLADDTAVLEVWRGGAGDVTAETDSLWAQDTLSWDRVTAVIGLRWDAQDLGIPGGPRPGTLAPRLGLIYQLGPEDDTLLRASASRFASRLGTDPAVRLDPGVPAAQYFLAGPGGLQPWYTANFQNAVDPGLEPEITDELVLGFEHAFLPELAIGLSATWRRIDHILEDRRLVRDRATGEVFAASAADWLPAGTLTGHLPDGTTYSVPFFDLRPDLSPAGGTRLVNGDRSQEYRGLTFEWRKRLTNRWMTRGHYTWQDWTWNLGPAFASFDDPTNTVGGGDDDGAQVLDPTGSLLRPHEAWQAPAGRWAFHVDGLVQLPYGINLAAAVNGRDGYALPYFQRVAREIAGLADVQIATLRTDDLLTVDTRLEWDTAVNDFNFILSLEAYNLLDENTVTERETQLGLLRAGAANEIVAPRTYRLGLRVAWR